MVSTHSRDGLANDRSSPDYSGRVGWIKGESNHEVAELLCDLPVRLSGDFEAACVDMNVDVVVAKRLPRSDIVSAVVPIDFDSAAITSVAVAVGEGPHSPLAVAIAERVADSLGVSGRAIAAYQTSDQEGRAQQRIGRLVAPDSTLDRVALHVPNPGSIAHQLSRETLLVHGAAGGSFIERHLTGTGNRLTARARGCVLVVRSSSPRCYQSAASPTAYALAPELLVADALQVMAEPFAPVVSASKLIGIVRTNALVTADPGHSIESSIEPVAGLNQRDPIRLATFEREHLGPGPLPVVDDDGNLVGVIVE